MIASNNASPVGSEANRSTRFSRGLLILAGGWIVLTPLLVIFTSKAFGLGEEAGATVPIVFAAFSFVAAIIGLIYTAQMVKIYDAEEWTLIGSARKLLRQEAAALQPMPPVPALPTQSQPAIGNSALLRKAVKAADILARVCVRYRDSLLELHLIETLHAIQVGIPLQTTANSAAEERHFAASERNLRAGMDIVLNLGIAGTFLSILIGFMGGQLTQNTLRTHVAPGLLSGLAAVSANIALRLCHSALLARQDQLARRVETVLMEDFTSLLPAVYLSPEVALAEAVRVGLSQQNEALRAALTNHTSSVQTDLKEHARIVTARMEQNSDSLLGLLKEQLVEPVQHIQASAYALSGSTGQIAYILREMEQQGSEWRRTVATLSQCLSDFLTKQAALLEKQQGLQQAHETAVKSFLGDHQAAVQAQLDANLNLMHRLMVELKTYHEQLLESLRLFQVQALQAEMAALAERLRDTGEEQLERFETLLATQKTHHEEKQDEMLAQFGMVVEAQLLRIEAQIADVLKTFCDELPDQLHEGIRRALSVAVNLVNEVRGQAVTLGTGIESISAAATQHLHNIRDWAQRIDAWQQNMERLVTNGQNTHNSLITTWQRSAQSSLTELEGAFKQTAAEILSGSQGIAGHLADLTARMDAIDGPAQRLQGELDRLGSSVGAFQDTLIQTTAQVQAMHTALAALQETAITASAVLHRMQEAEKRQLTEHAQAYDDLTRNLANSTAQIGTFSGQMPQAIQAGNQLSWVLAELKANTVPLLEILKERTVQVAVVTRDSAEESVHQDLGVEKTSREKPPQRKRP